MAVLGMHGHDPRDVRAMPMRDLQLIMAMHKARERHHVSQ